MMQLLGPPTGNAITSNTAFYFSTPVTRPKGSTVTIECFLKKPGDISSSTVIFDFTASKTVFRKQSSNKKWEYQYYGNNYSVVTPSNVTQPTKKIELKTASKLFTLTLADDSTVDSNASSAAWPSITTQLRLHLATYFAVKEITQTDSNNTVVHHMIPDYQNGVVGMVDTVTETFYGDTTGNAYLTTI